jgi:hypothetical protein
MKFTGFSHNYRIFVFSDLDQEPGKSHFIFSAKRQVYDYLKEKAAEGKITYSTVATGAFFDWCAYCYSSFSTIVILWMNTNTTNAYYVLLQASATTFSDSTSRTRRSHSSTAVNSDGTPRQLRL